MFNSVNEAFNWMVSFTNLEKKPDKTKRGYRLDKMVILLEKFGNPHKEYKIIHVAGSKGKGSTSAFLSSMLTEAGFKTGVYSSPHLVDFRERITNNHNFFKDDSYLSTISNIKNTLESLDMNTFPGGEPTTFELMTLAAFLIFKLEECNWVILETGLGGRLDSTNVVIPEVSVITPIELEHTDILGDTLEAIASEKAGIIKPNKPIFTSNTTRTVVEVIKNRAKSLNSPFYELPKNFKTTVNSKGTILNFSDRLYTTGLQGEIQGENALLALTVVHNLFPSLTYKTLAKGLSKTSIPGRFQKKGDNPTIILDGAHTENSIKTTLETFSTIYGEGTIIFGALIGKNIDSMVDYIKQYFNEVIISTPGNFKESDLESLSNSFTKSGIETIVLPSPKKALELARERQKPILVTGSFYMAGEIAKLLESDE